MRNAVVDSTTFDAVETFEKPGNTAMCKRTKPGRVGRNIRTRNSRRRPTLGATEQMHEMSLFSGTPRGFPILTRLFVVLICVAVNRMQVFPSFG